MFQFVDHRSVKAYGAHEPLHYTEDSPLHGAHPYDASKSSADLIGQAYAKTFGLPVVITRCGNFYGGGDLNWNQIVRGTIRSVLRGQRPIIRSDGKSIRDYLYAEDGAAAALEFVKNNSEFAIEEPPFLFNEGQIRKRITYWPGGFIKRV